MSWWERLLAAGLYPIWVFLLIAPAGVAFDVLFRKMKAKPLKVIFAILFGLACYGMAGFGYAIFLASGSSDVTTHWTVGGPTTTSGTAMFASAAIYYVVARIISGKLTHQKPWQWA